MSKVIYEVTLSPTGQHSVSVKSDDPILLKDALPMAKKIQEKLLQVEGAATPPTPVNQPDPQREDHSPAPLCGVHSTPMTQVQGKRGSFWSCHKKNPDGSWCNYKPAKAREMAPPPAYSYPAA
jgi:hypothetical protein